MERNFKVSYLTLVILVTKLSLTFVIPWTVAHQARLSMGFLRQAHWTGLPFPSPGDLPDPGIKPTSPALQTDSLPLSHQGSPNWESSRVIVTAQHEKGFLDPCWTLSSTAKPESPSCLWTVIQSPSIWACSLSHTAQGPAVVDFPKP